MVPPDREAVDPGLPAGPESDLLAADLYRLLSGCLSYPDEANIRLLRETIEELRSARVPAPFGELLGRLRDSMDEEQVRADYARLFIKAVVPMTETASHPKYDVMSHLAAFYEAFGLTPRTGDSPDSMPYELEFMSILCLKIALASTSEEREVAVGARARFVSEHLRDFAAFFGAKLLAADPCDFYRVLAELLDAVIGRSEPPGDHKGG